ncbi:hypothetical protein AB0392_55615 [Nonomuraea angiospora]|uniref:hypothetical protein n=1 Tax=Nonomuraea angiospora TaxID=46172 RepID=UPI00344BBFB8
MTTEYLQEDGKLYELLSYYCLPDDAWSIEVIEMSESRRGLMHVLLPDEDMERPCEVVLEGHIPTGVLKRAIEEVASLARHAGASFERTRNSTPAAEPSDP